MGAGKKKETSSHDKTLCFSTLQKLSTQSRTRYHHLWSQGRSVTRVQGRGLQVKLERRHPGSPRPQPGRAKHWGSLVASTPSLFGLPGLPRLRVRPEYGGGVGMPRKAEGPGCGEGARCQTSDPRGLGHPHLFHTEPSLSRQRQPPPLRDEPFSSGCAA